MRLTSRLATLRHRGPRWHRAAIQVDDIGFFAGLVVAVPVGLTLWAGIVRGIMRFLL